jgi:hypothetical protein
MNDRNTFEQGILDGLSMECNKKFDGNNKIALIKWVREITGAGLKDAKEFVEDSISKTFTLSITGAWKDIVSFHESARRNYSVGTKIESYKP